MIMRFRELHPGHIDQFYHWCPRSQTFAGVDALLGHLEDGWEIQGDIGFDDYWFNESRRISVYHFMLTKQDKHVIMHVLYNPVLERLLTQHCEKTISPESTVDELGIDVANYPLEQASASNGRMNGF
jgi:hypothetical protein